MWYKCQGLHPEQQGPSTATVCDTLESLREEMTTMSDKIERLGVVTMPPSIKAEFHVQDLPYVSRVFPENESTN